MKLNLEEKADWLRLSMANSVGPITFMHLLKRYGNVSSAIKALPTLCTKLGSKKAIKIMPQEKAVEEILKYNKNGIELVARCEEDYPKALLHIPDAPVILSCKGNLKFLNKPSLGIVGSRNASLQGIAFAKKIAQDASDAGIIVISGLARGIDAAAHKGSVERGTVAVMAGGVDIIYPQENKKLYEEIEQKGVIVSESTMGQEPRPQSFTYRNRIISGMANMGILVVEAAFKSGSLITARYAGEQGRDVFAIPGHPYDPRAQGTNYLIKQGAILVEKIEDIIAHKPHTQNIDLFNQEEYEIAEDIGKSQFHQEDSYEETKEFLLQKLSSAPIKISDLLKITAHSISDIQGALAELELMGEIEIESRQVVRKMQ